MHLSVVFPLFGALVLCFFAPFLFAQQNLPQEPFIINVAGTFNYSGAADCPYCTQCNGSFTGCGTWEFLGPTIVPCPAIGKTFDDESGQRWGNCYNGPHPCLCFPSSGIGFRGYTNVTMISNPPQNFSTRIARITHYNNGIDALYINQPRHLRLTITLTSAQLPGDNSFTVQYPLQFFETPNDAQNNIPCDYAIQISPNACDDIFWFGSTTTSQTFQVGNVKYTLKVAGFLRELDTAPVQRFITPEYNVNTAYLYASIITVCEEIPCGHNSVFLPYPVCGCSCPLTNSLCQITFGSDWIVDTPSCTCVCAANTTAEQQSICQQEFPGGSGQDLVWNPERCGCGCDLNNTYCESINPNYEVAPSGLPCECACAKKFFVDCAVANGPFYQPLTNACVCACVVDDNLCSAHFGAGYYADYQQCGCLAPSSGGLSSGAIAGIVIGSVAGAVLLALALLGLLALLVFLIMKGIIPGIYGYKIAPADVSTMQTSPMYKDTWSTSNAMAG